VHALLSACVRADLYDDAMKNVFHARQGCAIQFWNPRLKDSGSVLFFYFESYGICIFYIVSIVLNVYKNCITLPIPDAKAPLNYAHV